MGKSFSRREFLQNSALAAGALAANGSVVLDPGPAYAAAPPPATSDGIGFGIIGVGMQGSGLLSAAVGLPGVQCLAAADLYDGRHALAKEIAGEKIFTTRRYKELLARPDIQAVIVAVPDHWHKQIVLDAIGAGKDVYCEKPMSHTLAEGAQMAAAATRSDRIVQIGSQRTSSAILARARELFRQGAIGELLQA
jgi:predicted dehydrogenase